MNSLVYNPLWSELKKYIQIYHANDTENGRVRIEIRAGIPPELTSIQMPCVSCGNPIYVVRRRRNDPKRGHGIGRLYIAVTCELSVCVGCSRGTEARDEYHRIANALAEQ